MRKIFFHPEAEKEMFASSGFYEEKARGLGIRFLNEVERSLKQISVAPNRWPVLSGKIRRYLFQRFHFCLLYRVQDDNIFIIAVMHLHREPDYWKARLEE